jgi:PadR family transcriptional regulator, regulatory protein PadR
MADNEVRLSGRMLTVLKFLLADVRKPRSGADIFAATGVSSGTLYPMLARLEAAGWLSSDWERVDPSEAGRPRRRYYTVTGVGQARARSALTDLQFTGELSWQM